MAYGISGTTSEACKILVINKNSNKVLKVKSLSAGNYSEYIEGGAQEVVVVGIPTNSSSHPEVYSNVTTKTGITFDSNLWFNLGTSGAPSILNQHSAIEYNGKMYIFGGSHNVWEYNISTSAWTQRASGATARQYHTAIGYNGKMYICGGSNGGPNFNDVWEYII